MPSTTQPAAPAELDAQLAGAIAEYLAHVDAAGLSARTRRTYGQRLRAFGRWLADHPKPAYRGLLSQLRARDYAVRDYRRHLRVTQKAAPHDRRAGP